MSSARVIPPGLLRAYRSLVRVAYLVLPGSRHDQERLYRAHRVVAEALPRRETELSDPDYAELRLRVLRGVLRPRRHGRSRPSWLRLLPAIGFGDDVALFGALDELSPEGRAAYALLHLEGLGRDAVRELLLACGVSEPDSALAETQALGARLDMSRAHQERLLERPPFDPTIVRVYARPAGAGQGRTLAVVCAVVLLCVAGLAFVREDAAPRPPSATGAEIAPVVSARDLRQVPEQTWRERFRLDLAAWDARGSLLGDDALADRALRAWRTAPETSAHDGVSAAPPAGNPQLLFAGEVDDSRVVVFYEEPRVARYVETADARRIDVHRSPQQGVANWPALRLTEGDDGVRYLLPPWVTEAATAKLATGGPDWKDLDTEDGVTDPVKQRSEPGCLAGPVLRLRAPEVAHGQPYTALDLGTFATSHIGYVPPPPAEIRRLGPHELTGDPAGFRLWSRIACSAAPPARAVEDATTWEFAVDELPEGGTARWICTRFGHPDGTGSARMTLLTKTRKGTRATEVGTRDNGWDCSNLSRQVAGGTWWRADSGRWHYLAAGSRDTETLAAKGGVKGDVEGTYLALPGPKKGPRPEKDVELTARNGKGAEMTVFGGTG